MNNLKFVLCHFHQKACFTRFLWKKDTDTEIEDYAMRVNIFGKTNSLCEANWAFKRAAPDDEYHIKKIIEENFYMDNLLYSLNCKLKLNELCIRLIILSSHGFNVTESHKNL